MRPAISVTETQILMLILSINLINNTASSNPSRTYLTRKLIDIPNEFVSPSHDQTLIRRRVVRNGYGGILCLAIATSHHIGRIALRIYIPIEEDISIVRVNNNDFVPYLIRSLSRIV